MAEESHSKPREEPKKNVHYLRSLIDKFVTVEIIRNRLYSGFVHCIDPISKSIILSIPSGDKSTITLIPGHAVLNISETPAANNSRPKRKYTKIFTDKEITERKTKIVNWLKKNMLPVSENNNIIDLGHVSILPPYSLNDICCVNPLEVIEIRKLITSMPENFES